MAQKAPTAPSSTPASSTQAKADPGDKVICKYTDPDTGSLLNTRHKVCHTKREWDQMNKDAADLIDSKMREPGRPK